ncbi:hypothetical protein ACQKMD_11040 [Viridibacillus sp. NPDC096237]|uniref:hypothetical protein n=1 Tax=Viridibacillus sp. NPDC096237 TaxID=3390721 RepID=UPI003D06163A
MSGKVKVSKDVAERINYVKGYTDEWSIIDYLMNSTLGKDEQVLAVKGYFNDYEVEQTPEENLAQQYNYALNEWEGERRRPLNISEKGVYKDGYIEGIRDALSILKIKIQGVNRL